MHDIGNAKTGEEGRLHIDESLVQKAAKDAVAKAGLTKRATCHTFRHSLQLTCSKQRRVRGLRRRNSASCADQSNHCWAGRADRADGGSNGICVR